MTIASVAACGGEPREPENNLFVGETVRAPDGVPIAYETHGTGLPGLVFVHGWSCDRRYWKGQLEPFSSEFQVVAVDLAGHGESGLGREDWTIASFGEDVAAVVEKLGLESVVLVGHSMGGDVILETARRMPERVLGLVWVDTYGELGNPRSREQVEAIVDRFRPDFESVTRQMIRSMFPVGADSSLVDWVVTDMSSAPPSVAIPTLEASFTYGRTVTDVVSELGLPIVAMNPDDSSNDVESMIRHGVEDVILMPEAGHFFMMEKPEEFNRVLSEVIDGFVR